MKIQIIKIGITTNLTEIKKYVTYVLYIIYIKCNYAYYM